MQLPDYFEFMCPVKTGSGYRALEHLPMDLASLNARRPLIVTEKKSQDKGLIKHMTTAFKTSGLTLGVYDGVTEMSGLETVRELYSLYLDKGFDSIIALGGGNVMDVAKVLNIAVSGKPEDLKGVAGVDLIPDMLKPLIYVPVSCGTGKETSGEATVEGLFFSSKFLMPSLAVIDPRMLKEEDPEKVVNTAMAALTYAAEGYACPDNNPFLTTYAQLAVDFVMNNLLDTVKNSLDEKGRLKALIYEFKNKNTRIALVNAACMAGYVYSNSTLGLASKIAHAVSEYCDTEQGIILGILLPYVLEYHAHKKGRNLSKIFLPMAGIDLYCSTPLQQRFDSAMGKIRHLQNEVFTLTSSQIPRTLEDTKLSKSRLSDIAAKVVIETNDGYDTAACLMILEHAFDGKPVTP